MTEAAWTESTNCRAMLEFLQGRVSDRKFRLFACGCCRRVWHRMTDERLHQAVIISEENAEGRSNREALEAASNVAYALALEGQKAGWPVASASAPTAGAAGWWPVEEYEDSTLAGWAGAIGAAMQVELLASDESERRSERKRNADLLRHIIGNPFKPYPTPPSWPSTVVQLAASLYEGQDCRLPLSDALEESGHGELAEHFRAETWHPKGCYAMDLILGKE